MKAFREHVHSNLWISLEELFPHKEQKNTSPSQKCVFRNERKKQLYNFKFFEGD